MQHRIADFCDKIDVIKEMSDELRQMKYDVCTPDKHLIKHQIDKIQSEMLVVAKDTGAFVGEHDV
jgi:hypothetical protein